ncbi:MAG: hypothetical protein H6755_03135 [Candidatus Omnitrophica bacterium]|nr:hypothetical protein [Candidatus Omnitrophota bacterium]
MKLKGKQKIGLVLAGMFLVWGILHYQHHGLMAINVVLFTIAAFFILVNLCADHLLVFGYGLPVILLCVGTLHCIKHGESGVFTKIAYALAGIVFLISLFNRQGLEFIYKYWMKVAHFIGDTITAILMMIMFYLVFTPIGIFLRLTGKDLLDRKIDKTIQSYWKLREKTPFDKERCTKQF